MSWGAESFAGRLVHCHILRTGGRNCLQAVCWPMGPYSRRFLRSIFVVWGQNFYRRFAGRSSHCHWQTGSRTVYRRFAGRSAHCYIGRGQNCLSSACRPIRPLSYWQTGGRTVYRQLAGRSAHCHIGRLGAELFIGGLPAGRPIVILAGGRTVYRQLAGRSAHCHIGKLGAKIGGLPAIRPIALFTDCGQNYLPAVCMPIGPLPDSRTGR